MRRTTAGAYSAAFGGFAQEGNVGQISIFLNDDRSTSTYAYVGKLLQKYQSDEPSAEISVASATQQGGGNQQQIDELVSASGTTDPAPYAAKVFTALQQTPGATGVQNSQTNAAPQMEIDFNRAALQSLDVSIGTAAAAVEAAFGGDVASQIETPDRGLTDIEVQYPRTDQTTLDEVLAIPLRAENGGIVRLGDVAYLKSVPAPLIITRQNRAQVVHVTGNVAPGYELSNVTRAFQKSVAGLHLPKTVTIRPAAQGQQDLMGQALSALLTSLAISIVLVFLLIVSLYNSYRTPFVTLFAIPVAVIGALGALWITHNTLNLYSLLGMILLVGLVTKNGILLVDYADTVRVRDGRSREEGIQEAASTRFRPIIMTTLAMVAGMLPARTRPRTRHRHAHLTRDRRDRRPPELARPNALHRPDHVPLDRAERTKRRNPPLLRPPTPCHSECSARRRVVGEPPRTLNGCGCPSTTHLRCFARDD